MRGCTDVLIMRTLTHKRSKAVYFRRGECAPSIGAILEWKSSCELTTVSKGKYNCVRVLIVGRNYGTYP